MLLRAASRKFGYCLSSSRTVIASRESFNAKHLYQIGLAVKSGVVLLLCQRSLSAGVMSCQGGGGRSCGDLSKKLTPQQYRVTQEKGTERAFTGEFYDHHEKGTYICICCETSLFSSETKYDSGSGWPSFYKTMEGATGGESVERKPDQTHGMVRVEVVCKNCQAHLGHVFDDGPEPTGERFCINSASLGFTPAKK